MGQFTVDPSCPKPNSAPSSTSGSIKKIELHRQRLLAGSAILCLLALVSGGAVAATDVVDGLDFAKDAVLVNFLMKNDVVLSRTLKSCEKLNVIRHESNGHETFAMSGRCLIKDNPQEDLDCPSYELAASGEIDNKVQATVRKLALSLVCHA